MGANNVAMAKESAAKGAKIAAEFTDAVNSENRKAANYAAWLNDQANATQTRKSKTAIKK